MDLNLRTSVSVGIWGDFLLRTTPGGMVRPQHLSLKRCVARVIIFNPQLLGACKKVFETGLRLVSNAPYFFREKEAFTAAFRPWNVAFVRVHGVESTCAEVLRFHSKPPRSMMKPIT